MLDKSASDKFIHHPKFVAFRSFSTGRMSEKYRIISTRLISYYRAEKKDSTICKYRDFYPAVCDENSSRNLYWRPATYLAALGLLKPRKRVTYPTRYKRGKARLVNWGFEITELGMIHDVYDVIENPSKFGIDPAKLHNR